MSKAQEIIVSIIKEAARSNRRENENVPGSASIREELPDYPGANAELNQRDGTVKELYREIIDEIEWSMNDGWMPEKMFSLLLPEARCLLRNIWPAIEEPGLTQAAQRPRNAMHSTRKAHHKSQQSLFEALCVNRNG